MSAAKPSDQTQQPTGTAQHPSFPESIWWLGFFVAIVFLLRDGLWHGQVPAFRDGFHFYFPQVVWYRQWLASGDWFPTWNHQSLFGVSVAGQSSYGLFYPLRVIWYSPGLDAAQAYSLYIAIHLSLAAAGMRFAARRLGLAAGPACLAAFSYALSCPVFFQLNNLIYLTSASWVGFAFGCFITIALTGRWTYRDVLISSVAMSCMMLSGDPQTMVNCGLLASTLPMAFTVRLVWRLLSSRRVTLSDQGSDRNWQATKLWCGLAATLVFVVSATAVQWVPMLRWTSHSGRMQSPVIEALITPIASATPVRNLPTETPDAKKTHRGVYDFSLSPWHVATLLFPSLGGHYQPTNARLFDAIPAEGRMWIPSLYLGFIPAWLLLHAIFARWRRYWGLLVLALFSLAAAFGSYAPTWVVREAARGIGWHELASSLPADPVGGVYWFLVEFVPGYSSMRYPAKWTVWFAAAACLFSATCIDAQSQPQTAIVARLRAKRMAYFALLGISLAGCCVALLILSLDRWNVVWSQALNRWLADAAYDVWLGSPSTAALGRSLLIAFGIPAISLIILRRSLLTSITLRECSWIVAWTLAEMILVASQWCTFVGPPTSDVDPPHRHPAEMPFLWADAGEANMASDALAGTASTAQLQTEYQQAFALGKLQLLDRLSSLHATESIVPDSVEVMRGELRRLDTLVVESPELSRRLARLGITHRLVREPDENGNAKLSWQALEQTPLPMCRLEQIDSPSQDARGDTNSLAWRWTSADTLEITGDGDRSQRLLVRQFDDGGWLANLRRAGIRSHPMKVGKSLHDLAIEVPEGPWILTLRRRWLY